MKRKKQRIRLKKAGGTIISILLIGLLVFFFVRFGQTPPDNPMKEKEADASKMYLISSTLSVDKEQLDSIENANINSGGQGDKVTEDEKKEEKEKPKEEQKKEEKEEKEEQKDKNDKKDEKKKDDKKPSKSLQDLIDKNKDTEEPGDEPSDEESDDGNEDDDEKEDEDPDGGEDMDLDETQSKELFTTSLKDDQVTEAEYPFTITLTEAGKKLKLVSMTVSVNGSSRRCTAEDRITLKEGANKVFVTIRFRDSKNNQIDASTRTYTIYYTPQNEVLLIVKNYRTGEVISNGDALTVYNEALWVEVTASIATSNGMKPVSSTLRLANQKKSPDSDGVYRLKLNTGEQVLKVTAGESGNNQKQMQCTINYKLDDFVLKFECASFTETISNNTSLGDRTFKSTSKKTYRSKQPEFGFKLTYSVTSGNEKITRIEAATRYGTTDLTDRTSADGYNYITLDASQATSIKVYCTDSEGAEQWYTWQITYQRIIDEEENNKKAPVIDASLSDGETVNKNPYILTVNVYDYNGNNLYPSNFSVSLNGQTLDFDGISGGAYEYNLYLTEGENHVVIKAEDHEQYVSEKKLTIYFTPVAENIRIHFSVSANVLGLGTWIDEDITVPAGMTVAQVLEERLAAYGYQTEYSGSPTSGNYFLRHIKKKGILNGYSISEEERALLEMEGYTIDENLASMDSLGELNFTQGSGWMLTLNHYFIGQSAGTRAIRDGDAIALMYTLDVGTDIGVDPNSGVN